MFCVVFTNHDSELFNSISGLHIFGCLSNCSSRCLHPIQRNSFLPRPSAWENAVSAARAAVPRDSRRLPLKGSWSTLPAVFKHNFSPSKLNVASIFLKKISPYNNICLCGQFAHTKHMGIRFPVYGYYHSLFPFHRKFVPCYSKRRHTRVGYFGRTYTRLDQRNARSSVY